MDPKGKGAWSTHPAGPGKGPGLAGRETTPDVVVL